MGVELMGWSGGEDEGGVGVRMRVEWGGVEVRVMGVL